jgi:hypothetical protein
MEKKGFFGAWCITSGGIGCPLLEAFSILQTGRENVDGLPSPE